MTHAPSDRPEQADESEQAYFGGTLGDLLNVVMANPPIYRSRDAPFRPPAWPPDLFALVAFVLQQSGAYSFVVSQDWRGLDFDVVHAAARRWREDIVGDRAAADQRSSGAPTLWRPPGGVTPPADLLPFWNAVRAKLHVRPTRIRDDAELCRALLHLLAIADEASVGAGITDEGGKGTKRDFVPMPSPAALSDADVRPIEEVFASDGVESVSRLEWPESGVTLCSRLVNPGFRVLPKMHTPQTGLTLRSMSHNLAFFVPREIVPTWQWADLGVDSSISLLIVPWPTTVYPKSFSPVHHAHRRRVREFAYDPEPWSPAREARLHGIMAAAREIVGDALHGVVFPELALTEKGWDAVVDEVTKPGAGPRLAVAGVGGARSGRRTNTARVCLASPASVVSRITCALDALPADLPAEQRAKLETLRKALPADPLDTPVTWTQHKHHRWCLDRAQIIQYHLGGALDIERRWWEAIDLPTREVGFLSIAPWLTLSVLICEDLARQDPVSSLLRTIGPNLVIALLMDGPQLPSRWPARYATVLADDPGSSVLTVSSLGMVGRSRPHGVSESRVIAMWKDRTSGSVTIDLPADAEAVVITLSRERVRELTADGRRDYRRTATLVLTGVHHVRRTVVDRHLEMASRP